ncbi:MAG: hypothetical protein HY907_06655 [Deltaproteobacteria bacterium]|nr:hypothetical protein [Deltaproteobacteria bacterium]
MNTTFSYGVRMLMCSNCGGPLQVPPTGGSVPCQYCGTVNQIAVRDERALVDLAHRPPINEAERLQRLRSQDGRPLLPPPALQGLFGPGGQIPPHRMQEALAVWQGSRNEVRATGSYEAAERLLFLTMALSNIFSVGKDLVRQRAMFETALEAFTLPRHRQMMLGFLSRNAAKMGDLASAERWLGMCDPQPEDLESDSAYRLSVAFIATARQDWNRVLQALGPNNTDVPIMDAYDILAAILRANAWERAGQLQGAVVVLQETMQKAGAQGRLAIEQILQANAEWNWCAASFPAANAAHAVEAGHHAAASQGGGVGTFLVIFGILMLLGAGGAIVAGASGGGMMGYSWALGPGIAGVVMLLVGLPMRASGKRAARLRLHGRRAVGRVLGIQSTGVRINNVPQVRLHLQVELEGVAPYQASTKLLLSPMAAAQLQPGAAVPVRVDPANPQDLILETD